MSDELDDLKTLMQAATPAPNAQRKAEILALAQENFRNVQGSHTAARPTDKRGPLARLTVGVKSMLDALSHRGALTATTAIAAVALVMIIPQARDVAFEPFSRSENETVETQTSAKADSEMSISVLEEPVVEVPMALEDAAAPSPKHAGRLQVQNGPSAVSTLGTLIEPAPIPDQNTESFANADPNALKVTADDPVSTFSIDVDTASYAVIRSSLMRGYLPPKDAVRVEEMVNYFPYSYPVPEGDAPFLPTITVAPTPWNSGTQLVHIGLQGVMPEIQERPPLNLVFLIDTSGSMQNPDKLPLLKQSFRLMLGELRPQDQVSIVTYAGSAGQVLEPTPASDRSTILAALDKLEAGGSTAGQAGLQQAYAVANSMMQEGDVSRVILATDGDFNVGLSDPDALKDYIARQRDTGTYLSVLGFGRGNLDDATMQALAQNGNGQAAYIDTLGEARKVLVDQLTGALFPIADDVKIQVEFNPAQIAEYRLIGYETRALRREDFNNDTVDAGEIGAGHSVTAIYEVTPVGSDAIQNSPLRYTTTTQADGSDEIGFFKLRYKAPGDADSQLIKQPMQSGQGEVTDDIRFSFAIAGFGQLLRDGSYLGDWTYDDAIALANMSKGDDAFGYRAEAVTLMRLAQTLSR
ncbi:von Willebrand factor A [Ruegeria sp. ANG-S4]|uniref:vWA domain-containing protein n=1 Tax=Ruegeria sp. ANG-S4 TaxID=1577904 RepID=UPI00057CA980|nr:VWA domain-containing protein [Ruegeria sp. ANG-S4]KIC45707.1 von Willebrand factor A [Ruegeria sp. ANG-S4]